MTASGHTDRGTSIETYRQAVYRLADGRKFRMSIPARPDDDDLLLDAALDELEQLRADSARLRAALAFARSVIKCGEPWTATCEREIDGALGIAE
jgi:hypothetical protein